MSEYGHFAVSGPGFHLDSWGAGPYVINVRGRRGVFRFRYRFEDSDRFGPQRLKVNGDPSQRPFGERSPFWHAWRRWKQQGRRLDDDGVTCLWDDTLEAEIIYTPLDAGVPTEG